MELCSSCLLNDDLVNWVSVFQAEATNQKSPLTVGSSCSVFLFLDGGWLVARDRITRDPVPIEVHRCCRVSTC